MNEWKASYIQHYEVNKPDWKINNNNNNNNEEAEENYFFKNKSNQNKRTVHIILCEDS